MRGLAGEFRESPRGDLREMYEARLRSCAHITDILEAWHALAVAFDDLAEHLERAHPQPALAIERSIHDELAHGFGILRDADDLVLFAFEVPVTPQWQHGSAHHIRSSGTT